MKISRRFVEISLAIIIACAISEIPVRQAKASIEAMFTPCASQECGGEILIELRKVNANLEKLSKQLAKK